jgi:hypothetical protein
MADIPRIKGNIAKMIAQNAPETDIDAYVAAEGISLDELRAKPTSAAAPALPDQYQKSAIEERDALKAKGVDTGAGYARRAIQGATAGFADEALAGLSAPLEMIKRGTLDPREGYKYAKAREDLILDDSRKNTGGLGTALEVGGGVVSGTGAARAGLSFGRNLAPNAGLGARSLASAGDAAAFGALAGAGEGNSFDERFKSAAQGGIIGGGVGGLTPGALRLAGGLVSPIVSNISARANPERYARSQVARALSETNLTPQQIADDVAAAAREGQGMYTVADALGNPGQRMLSTVARSPGRARTDVVEFLDNRQAGQGRRVSGALAEGFDAPQTAAQTEARLTAQRGVDADAAYGAVRNDAGRVDLVAPINRLDRTIGTQPGQVLTPANDSIEAVLTPFRQRLSRVNPDDFEAVQRIRGDMADAAQTAMQNGQGNRARLIGAAVRELDGAMENASQGFREANRGFAQASRDIEAVQSGRQAATRGRTEDIIPEFQAQSPAGQGAYRSGYVDPLIQQSQGAAFGANKARPLINDAFQAEAGAMAPGAPLMQRRIGREDTMFQTRNAATGNSKTAENLNDDAAMSVDPSMVANLLSGNWGGVARGALQASQNVLSGNTPAVREEVARLLTMRGGNVSAQQMQEILAEAVNRIRTRQLIASQLGRGASAGLAVAPSSNGKR